MTHGHTNDVVYNFDMTYARFDKSMITKFGDTAVISSSREHYRKS